MKPPPSRKRGEWTIRWTSRAAMATAPPDTKNERCGQGARNQPWVDLTLAGVVVADGLGKIAILLAALCAQALQLAQLLVRLCRLARLQIGNAGIFKCPAVLGIELQRAVVGSKRFVHLPHPPQRKTEHVVTV